MRIYYHSIIVILTVSLATVAVSACGKKGPLYIPDKQQQAR